MSEPYIYLNNAATTYPKPFEVIEAVERCMREPVFESGRGLGVKSPDYVELARESVAGFFGAEKSENTIFTGSATDSLNMLISGFVAAQKTKPHVLTTELEHNSVLRPLFEYEKSNKLSSTILPFDKNFRVTLESIENSVRKDTKLMIMSHAGNVVGSKQNIEEIGKYLRDMGIYFIVDAAQSAGYLDINLKNIPADALVFTGHKGLFGLSGTGGFCIREPDCVEPTRFGGTGTNSASPSQPREMPERFECGTHNYAGLASLWAGVEFVKKEGPANIREKTLSLTKLMINIMSERSNVTIYNKNPDVPVMSFNIRGLDCDDLGFILSRRYGIISRSGLACAPLVHKRIDGGKGAVRFSPSYFSTREECEKAALAVCEVSQAI